MTITIKMRNSKLLRVALALSAWTGGAASICSANPPSLPPDAPVRVELTVDGYTLQTLSGMTLYYDDAARLRSYTSIGACPDKPSIITDDKTSGMGPRPVVGAKFVKSCTQKWPPFFANVDAKSVGDFTLVDRPGGKQWAFMGRPLYLSVKDKKPGDRNGGFDGGIYIGAPVSNTMRVAVLPEELPMGMQLSLRDEGLIVTGANGKAVYTPTRRVAASDERLTPILAPALAHVSEPWSVVETGTDRKQLAFNGKPMYALMPQIAEAEVEQDGQWKTIIYHRSAGRPLDIGRHLTLDGEVYTDREGRTLYTYTCNTANINGTVTGVPCDDPGDPAGNWVALCGSAEECAKLWKPYLAPKNAKPLGLWSIVDVAYPMFTDPQGMIYPPEAPRVKAWAYRGYPVYTYSEDTRPGDLLGDRSFGLWDSGMFDMLHVPGRELSE